MHASPVTSNREGLDEDHSGDSRVLAPPDVSDHNEQSNSEEGAVLSAGAAISTAPPSTSPVATTEARDVPNSDPLLPAESEEPLSRTKKKPKTKTAKKGGALHPCMAQHGSCHYGEYCKLKDLPGNTCIHHYQGMCAHGDFCRWRHAIHGIDIREWTGITAEREEVAVVAPERSAAFQLTSASGKVQVVAPSQRDDSYHASTAVVESTLSAPMELPAYLKAALQGEATPTPYRDLVLAHSSPASPSPSPAPVQKVVMPRTAAEEEKEDPRGVGLHPCVALFGSCKYGDRCLYAERRADVCLFFLQGRCRNAEHCPYRHESEADFVRHRTAAVLHQEDAGSPSTVSQWSVEGSPAEKERQRHVDPGAGVPPHEEGDSAVLRELCERYPDKDPETLWAVASMCGWDTAVSLQVLREASVESSEPLDSGLVALLLQEEEVEQHSEQRLAEERSQMVLTLRNLFPDVGLAVLTAVLERHRYDFTAAYDTLGCSQRRVPERGLTSSHQTKRLAGWTAADELKRQRLTERFPQTDPETITRVLEVTEGNEKMSIEVLNFFVGCNTPIATRVSPAGGGAPQKVVASSGGPSSSMSKGQTSSSGSASYAVAAGKGGSRSPYPTAKEVVMELEKSSSDGQWSSARSQAYSLNDCRRELVACATKAFVSGNGKAANDLSKEARQLEAKYYKLNRLAMLLLEQQRLKTNSAGVLDLHFFHIDEVEEVLFRRLELCTERRLRVLKVVTGPGQHSRSGKAKLYPLVESLLVAAAEKQRGRRTSVLSRFIARVSPDAAEGSFQVFLKQPSENAE